MTSMPVPGGCGLAGGCGQGPLGGGPVSSHRWEVGGGFPSPSCSCRSVDAGSQGMLSRLSSTPESQLHPGPSLGSQHAPTQGLHPAGAESGPSQRWPPQSMSSSSFDCPASAGLSPLAPSTGGGAARVGHSGGPRPLCFPPALGLEPCAEHHPST